MSEQPPEKPYLDDLRSGEHRMGPVIEWARYLGTTFGTSGALNALRYYQRIDWITPEVRREMERYLQGLSIEEIHSKKYDEPATLSGSLEMLSGTAFGAHARSLRYVATIADDDLEGDMLRARMARHRAGTDVSVPTDVAIADGGERSQGARSSSDRRSDGGSDRD